MLTAFSNPSGVLYMKTNSNTYVIRGTHFMTNKIPRMKKGTTLGNNLKHLRFLTNVHSKPLLK